MMKKLLYVLMKSKWNNWKRISVAQPSSCRVVDASGPFHYGILEMVIKIPRSCIIMFIIFNKLSDK